MIRSRTHRDLKRSWPYKRTIRNFDDDESDETILGLGFVDTRTASGTLESSAAGD
jgi:hypothetical protein